MITERKYISKILYTHGERCEDYTVYYQDRSADSLAQVGLETIVLEQETFMTAKTGGASIPLHRIRRIEKSGTTVWERPEKKS